MFNVLIANCPISHSSAVTAPDKGLPLCAQVSVLPTFGISRVILKFVLCAVSVWGHDLPSAVLVSVQMLGVALLLWANVELMPWYCPLTLACAPIASLSPHSLIDCDLFILWCLLTLAYCHSLAFSGARLLLLAVTVCNLLFCLPTLVYRPAYRLAQSPYYACLL